MGPLRLCYQSGGWSPFPCTGCPNFLPSEATAPFAYLVVEVQRLRPELELCEQDQQGLGGGSGFVSTWAVLGLFVAGVWTHSETTGLSHADFID